MKQAGTPPFENGFLLLIVTDCPMLRVLTTGSFTET